MLDILKGMCEILIEVSTELFNHKTESKEDTTYEYFMNLSYEEQKNYFQYNEYLKDYYDTDYYSTDRRLTAIHAQQIANKLNKEFTNKNKRY